MTNYDATELAYKHGLEDGTNKSVELLLDYVFKIWPSDSDYYGLDPHDAAVLDERRDIAKDLYDMTKKIKEKK